MTTHALCCQKQRSSTNFLRPEVQLCLCLFVLDLLARHTRYRSLTKLATEVKKPTRFDFKFTSPFAFEGEARIGRPSEVRPTFLSDILVLIDLLQHKKLVHEESSVVRQHVAELTQ